MNLERMLLGEPVRTAKGVAQNGKSDDAKASGSDAADFAGLIDKGNRDGAGNGGSGRGPSELEGDDAQNAEAAVGSSTKRSGGHLHASKNRMEFEAALESVLSGEVQNADEDGPQPLDADEASDEAGRSETTARVRGAKSGAANALAGDAKDAPGHHSVATDGVPKSALNQIAQVAAETAAVTASQQSRLAGGFNSASEEGGNSEPARPEQADTSRLGARAGAKANAHAAGKGDGANLFSDVPEILQSLEQVSNKRSRSGQQSGEVGAGNPATVKARVVGQETHLPVVPQWRLAAQNGTGKAADATQVPDDAEALAQTDPELDADALAPDRVRDKRNVRADTVSDIIKDARSGSDQPGVGQQLGEKIRDALKPSGAQTGSDISRLNRITQPTQSQGSQLVKILDVELTPEHLGSVTVRLSLKGDALSVHVTSGSQAAMAQLNADKDILTEVLKRSGYSVDEVVIVKSEFEPTRHNFGHSRHDLDTQMQRADVSRSAEGDKGAGSNGQGASGGFDRGRNGDTTNSRNHENIFENNEATNAASQGDESQPDRPARGIVI